MPDRPDECSHCKKPAIVTYKEVLLSRINCLSMCEDCPILQQKLTGQKISEMPKTAEKEMGLCCGNCGTTLESIKTGNPLGCRDCYSIFGDVLIQELESLNGLPERLTKNININKSQSFHIGKSPSRPVEIPGSSRLTALNQALNEALKKENYEQAAWLRDQIKDLMEHTNDRKKTST
ncbi:MAG: hypothetical protein EBZ47_07310 [Chlamydiae bacterium]|nr:hypothetical protein [Chlamydiota bacterium]